MFSGLYGDLPQAKGEVEEANTKEGGSWAGRGLMAPSNLKRPGGSVVALPPSVLRAGAGGRGRGRDGPGPVAPGRGRGRASSATPQPAAGTDGPVLASVAAATPAPLTWGTEIREEYDPARPNDYEAVCRQREQQRKEAEAEAERQERLRELRELEAMEMQRAPDEGPCSGVSSGGGLGAGGPAGQPAPITGLSEEARRAALNLSGEEAFRRRAALSAQPQQPQPPPGGPAGGKGMGLAQKMLEKMGWKEGEGLGRARQGMATPLQMKKTADRAGVIVAAEPARQAGAAPPARGAVIRGTPTRVVLLRNMVGPGEVDESLEDEVGQECSKYGTVQSVLIFEVTTPSFPHEEAVRIFVQFDRVEAATKALIDLQGRFFGGRTVVAAFYDEARFERSDLAPSPSDPPMQ